MESLRDVKRVMEREIEKGSCPLTFGRLELPEKPFQFIGSEKKLDEVLSYLLRLGDYKQYAEKTVINNVYMDLDMLCRKPQFRRTHAGVERREIYQRIQRYKKKLHPDYEGRVCLETMRCMFHIPEEAAEQYKVIYNGQETYGFVMSNKYILGLFTCCETARKSVMADGVECEHLAGSELKILSLESVRDVLFQALLLDNVSLEKESIRADMCTVMILK